MEIYIYNISYWRMQRIMWLPRFIVEVLSLCHHHHRSSISIDTIEVELALGNAFAKAHFTHSLIIKFNLPSTLVPLLYKRIKFPLCSHFHFSALFLLAFNAVTLAELTRVVCSCAWLCIGIEWETKWRWESCTIINIVSFSCRVVFTIREEWMKEHCFQSIASPGNSHLSLTTFLLLLCFFFH